MQSNNTLIKFDNVFFKYADQPIIEGISFEIKQGDFIGMIGPNGAGKTTVIKLILGLLKPSSGNISINIDTANIGYVPQHASQKDLVFPATVFEVVSSGIISKFNILTSNDISSIESTMSACAIGDLRTRLISELSGGQRQRVFIARALAKQPKILLLDEPETGVDAKAEKDFYNFLDQLNNKNNTTIVMISHNIEAISDIVRSVLCINRKMTCHVDIKDFNSHDYVNQLYADNYHKLSHKH